MTLISILLTAMTLRWKSTLLIFPAMIPPSRACSGAGDVDALGAGVALGTAGATAGTIKSKPETTAAETKRANIPAF
jgi:hypothetical protein